MASPVDCKTDPCSWLDAAFYAGRDQLVDGEPELVWKVVVGRANIRSAPNTSSRIVARYEPGHAVSVEAAVQGKVVTGNGTWYKLRGEGYVWGNLVRVFYS